MTDTKDCFYLYLPDQKVIKCYDIFSIVINVFHQSIFHIFEAIDIAWGVVIWQIWRENSVSPVDFLDILS